MVCQGFKGGKDFTDLPLEGGFEPSLSADDSIISGGGERVRVGTGENHYRAGNSADTQIWSPNPLSDSIIEVTTDMQS